MVGRRRRNVAKWAIGLLILGQATVAQARPSGDRLLSAPQPDFGGLYRFNAQDFFLKGQERLESEVRGLSRRRSSDSVLKLGKDDGNSLPCGGAASGAPSPGASSTATQTCGD